MRRYEKEMNKREIIGAWYGAIIARGYFDYWLDYDEVEQTICNCYPTISRTFIHSIFWKIIINDKNFLAKYEYQCYNLISPREKGKKNE